MSNRDIDFGTIRIERGAAVTGRIVAAGDRRPVAGAALFLGTRLGSRPLVGLSAVGKSAEDGSFALPERLGANAGEPAAFSHRRPCGRHRLGPRTGREGQERVSFEIVARDGRSATVRTLDAAGRPVEGALVLAAPSFAPFGDGSVFNGCPERPDLAAADSPLAAFASRILRVTSADGAASFSGLPEGRDDPWFGPNVANRIVFCAFREGFEAGRAELDLASRTESVTIELTPLRERAITGVVRDESGSPVAGASVSYANRPSRVLTNSAGEYRIPADLRAPTCRTSRRGNCPRIRLGDAARDRRARRARSDARLPARPGRAAASPARRPNRTPLPRRQHDALPRSRGRIWYLPLEGRNATGEDGTFTFSKSDAGPMDAERSGQRGLGIRMAANGLRRRVRRDRSPPGLRPAARR